MNRDASYLLDILEAARKIVRITSGKTQSDFFADDVLQDSAIRQIEIIGEAARRISTETQQLHSHVPWHRIIGMRNHLIHEYREIDLTQVWNATQFSIPELIRLLEPLVPPEN